MMKRKILTGMDRSILHIALPSIVSNITVPLLALADTTIVGHLGAAAYIGAIAVGGMVFNMIYWLFGFLRMGTGGMTAQAYGAGDRRESMLVLTRSLTVALCISALMIALQEPLIDLTFHFVSATPEVARYARQYYTILIWGAPAVLGLYSFAGWFLGMQNARIPMAIALVQNVVNIAVSLFLVFVLGWKVGGVAAGTLVAQYAGVLMAVVLWRSKYSRLTSRPHWREVWHREAFGRFFTVNRDIFLRTLCLIAVSTYFTSAGSAQGDLVLAANALLMQFFILFSYVMDGFAYAGEALGGRFYGASDRAGFSRLTRRLFVWGIALGVLFTLLYCGLGEQLLAVLTDREEVLATAHRYLPFAVAIPAVSLSAFLLDGLFIGTTSTRLMLAGMAAATLAFFTVIQLFPFSNDCLWSAFLCYLGMRGLAQGLCMGKVMRKFRTGNGK